MVSQKYTCSGTGAWFHLMLAVGLRIKTCECFS